MWPERAAFARLRFLPNLPAGIDANLVIECKVWSAVSGKIFAFAQVAYIGAALLPKIICEVSPETAAASPRTL